MKILSSTLSVALACGLMASASAQTSNFGRTPAISPDGLRIAFSYQGDIWTYDVNKTRSTRITIHEAYEHSPVFSPDGSKIGFSGNRYGNDDVYAISSEGGLPKRLTFHSTGDKLTDWKGEALLFETNRAFRQVEWDKEIYSVNQNGGTPSRILDAVGEMAVQSPNGQYIAFVRGACRIEREAYSGPADMEVWIYDTKSSKYTQVTKNEVNDYLPRWKSDDELYFISSVEGKYNIQSVKINGTEVSAAKSITNFTDNGVRYFDVAASSIVMERANRIYLMNNGGPVQAIDLGINADYRFDPMEKKTYSNNISSYEISPNGKNVAIGIRGEVFVKALDKEKKNAVNLSKHAYRDYDITWLNDTTLLFISDREGGQYDIYMATSNDPKKSDLSKSLKHKLKRITNTAGNEGNIQMSPDGKKLLFVRSDEGYQVIVADINASGKISGEKVLIEGWDEPSGIEWSPDSRYIAYSQSDLTFNSEIYIMDVKGGDPVNVSMHPKGDYGPFWSADGSKLGFISERNNGDNDVWFAWLQKEEWQKTKQDREEGYYFDDAEEDKSKKDKKKDKKDKKKKKEVEPIEIDFEDIHVRLDQVTSLPGNEGQVTISKDGKTFYFTASSNVSRGSDLYSIKFDGTEIKQLSKGGKRPYGFELDPNSDNLFAIKNGVLNKIDNKKGSFTAYPHSAKMTIDHNKEREQVFEEGWSALNQGFYDPNFHGNDWEALKNKYKPWAMEATTSQDFRYVFNLMLGQLNASHMGIYGSNPESTLRERTGRLGIEVKATKGGVEVTHVIRNSPADREKSKLNEGDIISHIGGEEIGANTNFYELLADQSGNQVLMTVKGKDGKERELVIRPSSSISTLLYEEWVKDRAELVEKYSGGRLGYIHIRGMNFPSFERFERELTASGLGKEGIVIDVRFNGGGWTTDYLMAVLNVKQHAYTVPRGAAKNLEKEQSNFKEYYPYSERLPLASWTKPSIAMCNESSYSNAEIFSHAYKNLGIGTLVGMPTFGAVISTGGKGLLDGSFVRMPFRGWYVKATGQNMENGPAVPDVLLENAPDDKSNGVDTQLKKAVDVLLKQIDAESAGK